ncbi:protein tyrosine phosphatase type IVA 1-like [Rhinolophus ferrumequinum]|uniref:protein tyrosine phosphatase type IVA 1-like n=1 Tax=Rhinolophus ferrumequinum TaxID=59479 RepID=UPI00140F72F1|nr:protein tyrosine phosphatase type IVA 1-like [Rhinolophus ferrumequinum]
MNYLAPAEITYKNMRFLIVHSPTKTSLNKFLQELKKNEVITIVGVCEATYNTTILEKEGIQILDWLFGDGGSPTSQIVDKWLKFVQQKFREAPGSCIAVHCATGLGRAPVLVALALMEGGMKHEDAILFIRQKCRGLLTASNFCIWRSIVL